MLPDLLFLSFREISELCVLCTAYTYTQSYECVAQGHQEGVNISRSHEFHFLRM